MSELEKGLCVATTDGRGSRGRPERRGQDVRTLGRAQTPPTQEATPLPTFWRRSPRALGQLRVKFYGLAGAAAVRIQIQEGQCLKDLVGIH